MSRALPAPLNIVIGIGLLAWSAPLGYKAFNLVNYGVHAEGEVTQLHKLQCSSGSKHNRTHYDCYKPVVSFDTQGGRTTFQAGQSKTEGGYRVGQKIAVVYMAENPQETADLDDDFQIWSGAGFAFIFGFGFLAGGILQLRRMG